MKKNKKILIISIVSILIIAILIVFVIKKNFFSQKVTWSVEEYGLPLCTEMPRIIYAGNNMSPRYLRDLIDFISDKALST